MNSSTPPGHVQWTATIIRVFVMSLVTNIAIGFPGTALTWWRLALEPALPVPARTAIVPQALMLVIEALVAMALWDRAIRIASFIWKNREPGNMSAWPDADVIERAIYTAFGVYLLVNGIPNLT
jgi:hypothetical protein